jgi:hypothetical protein
MGAFYDAQKAFLDPNCLIAKDWDHSVDEPHYYCFGRVEFVSDFFSPPHQLVLKEEPVTLALTKDSVDFFKK